MTYTGPWFNLKLVDFCPPSSDWYLLNIVKGRLLGYFMEQGLLDFTFTKWFNNLILGDFLFSMDTNNIKKQKTRMYCLRADRQVMTWERNTQTKEKMSSLKIESTVAVLGLGKHRLSSTSLRTSFYYVAYCQCWTLMTIIAFFFYQVQRREPATHSVLIVDTRFSPYSKYTWLC